MLSRPSVWFLSDGVGGIRWKLEISDDGSCSTSINYKLEILPIGN